MSIDDTLTERRGTHGDYTHNARIAQQIMDVLATGPSWGQCNHVQRESLHMFAHKMARIVGGNPNERDHWHDIAGYAKLTEDRIGVAKAKPKRGKAETIDVNVTLLVRCESCGKALNNEKDQFIYTDRMYCVECYETQRTLAEMDKDAKIVMVDTPSLADMREEIARPATPDDGGQHASTWPWEMGGSDRARMLKRIRESGHHDATVIFDEFWRMIAPEHWRLVEVVRCPFIPQELRDIYRYGNGDGIRSATWYVKLELCPSDLRDQFVRLRREVNTTELDQMDQDHRGAYQENRLMNKWELRPLFDAWGE